MNPANFVAKKNKAIDITASLFRGDDFSQKEEEILKDIVGRTGFVPEEVIWRSNYFGTNQIGAVHYAGKYKGSSAVLKIQGVRPKISEIFMIERFAAQNKSKLIRPPKLFTTLGWNDDRGYEALIMEKVTGEKIVQSGKLQTRESIHEFFKIYQEYRENCINEPWLPKGKKKVYRKEDMEKAKKMVGRIKPDSPFRQAGDLQLLERAGEVLNRVWKNVDMEFLHGHFSVEDLIRQGDEIVLFSNLFWKWKYPFYDAVFAYHWFIYTLERIKGITSKQVEQQRNLWLKEMFSLPRVRKSPENKKLLKAALLERAIGGIVSDSVAYIEESNPIAEYMVVSTREQLRKLVSEL